MAYALPTALFCERHEPFVLQELTDFVFELKTNIVLL